MSDAIDGLSRACAAALKEAALDAAELRCAEAAIRHALVVAGGLDFIMVPWVGVSDEGVVTFEWGREAEGAVLIFSDDDTFGLSIKGPGDHYTTGYYDLLVSDGVPPNVVSKIRWLAAMGRTVAVSAPDSLGYWDCDCGRECRVKDGPDRLPGCRAVWTATP